MSRYYEEGYIEVDYFEEVIAVTGTYYEDGYIESGYFEGDAVGSVQEVYAALTSVVEFTNIVDVIKQTNATLAADFAVTENSQKISDVVISTTPDIFIFASTVNRIVQSGATLIDAFIPTVTASGFKNSTAIIDAVSTLNSTASVTKDVDAVLSLLFVIDIAVESIIGATEFASDINAIFSVSPIDVNKTLQTTADINAQTTQTTVGNKTLQTTADINAIFSVSPIDVNKTLELNSSIMFEFTTVADNNKLINADSDMLSSANTTATAGTIKEVNSDVIATTQTTAGAGKIHNAEIEALTLFTTGFSAEGVKNSTAIIDSVVNLLATVNVNRDNDITLNNIISLSLQSARTRDSEFNLLASFEGVNSGARFRDTNSNLAFSFAMGNNDNVNNGIGTNSDSSVTRTTSATLATQTTVNANANIIKSTDVVLTTTATSVIDGNRIRFGVADFEAFYTTANPITDEGTGIGGNSGDGSLVITPVEAHLTSSFVLYAFEDIRPLQVRITDVNGDPNNDLPSILSSTDRFKIGSASIRTGTNQQALSAFLTDDIFDVGTGDFTLEYWVDHNGTDAQFASVYIDGEYLSVQFRRDTSQIVVSTALPSYSFTFDVSLTDTVGEFDNVAFVRYNGNFYLYINGESASTSGSRDFSGFNIVDADRFMIFPHTFTHYYDEIRLSKTARYTTNYTPRLTPFSNDADTVLLIHGDGNVKDSIEVLNTAQLFASTSLTAELSEVKIAELGTDAVATLQADANILRGIDAVASTQTSLQASAGKIQQLTAVADSSATVVVDTGKILQFEADCGSLFTPDFDANASINYTAILDSVATVDASITKTTAFNAQLNTEVVVTATAERTRSTTATLATAVTTATLNDKIVNADSNITAAADIALTSRVISTLQGEIAATSEFAINIAVGNILEGNATLTSAFVPNLVYKVVDIDRIVYVVPSESRVFTIHSEKRSFTIADETRTYTIGA